MRGIKFFLVFGILVGLIITLNTNQPFGTSVPALGKLLNPFTGFWQNAESKPEPERLNISANDLSETAEVFFDERMVPHIYAANNEDAAFVNGYIHAMHRLWQMDISTRAVGGRLSEVLGERTLNRDRIQRKKGIVYGAENTLRAWMSSPEEAALLNAYAAGVNAYLDQLKPKDYPIEFKILGYQPERWTPMRSALFIKNMAESLCARHLDLEATNTKALLGDDLFEFLYPEENPKQLPIIPQDVEFDFEALTPFPAEDAPDLLTEALPYEMFELPPAGNGSNNWAVAPQKTANGNAILCSDPHLSLTLPAIWYEVHINTPGVNSYGVSLPSEPGVLIGFNQFIAWGETNVGHDVLDWYTIDWVDEAKTKYRLDEEVLTAEIRTDTIHVKGRKAPHIETTKYTVWGPVVYEDSTSKYQDMAMHWIANDSPSEKPFYDLGSFWRLMAAKNHTDYQKALKGYENPAQNFAFASRDGDIAITVNGSLPVKRDQQGRFIQDGSKSSNGWNGYIPRDQLPQVLNPARGYISSANQKSTDADYPYYYNSEGFDDYRGRSVNLRLDTMEQITVQDMMKMQTTSFSLFAKDALAVILPYLDKNTMTDAEKEAFEKLEDWDYYYKKDAEIPIVFEIFKDSLYRMTFDEFYTLRKDQSVLFPKSSRLLSLLQESPAHAIFDHQQTKAIEDAAAIVNRAFKAAVANVPTDQKWSTRNNASVPHMAAIEPFGRRGLSMGGSNLSLNAIRGTHGPSWRMIVEMAKEGVKAYGLYPGGQSGNPGSIYYDNMVDTWASGDYDQLIFPKNKKEMEAVDYLFKMTFTN